MLTAFDDLEIRIFSKSADGYPAEIRLVDSLVRDTLSPRRIESFGRLSSHSEPRVYGIQLFDWLFRGKLRDALRHAQLLADVPSRQSNASSTIGSGHIRLRLWLDPQSPELHRPRWEGLYDPDVNEPLSLSMAFSRFMITQLPRGGIVWDRPLRMLLVTANLDDVEGLDRYQLGQIDASLERRILKEATRPLGQFLHLDRMQGNATLEKIGRSEQEGYHIFHLVAHAVFLDERGYLVLTDDEGRADLVPFEAVVDTIAHSSSPPYLVFLAVPLRSREQSGGTLVNLAPMLIEAGAQAVVAVQGPIDAESLQHFTERFYASLTQGGAIDVAVAYARSAIYDPKRWEWTYPVLYMRTPDAQLFQPLSYSATRTVLGVNIDAIG